MNCPVCQYVPAFERAILIGFARQAICRSSKTIGRRKLKLHRDATCGRFGVVVHGVVGAGDLRKVGRVGVKAILYFEAVTTVALVMGLLIAHFFAPGAGMNIDPSKLDAGALGSYTDKVGQVTSTVDVLMRIIPTTIFGRPVVNIIEIITDVLFKVIGFIVKLAPIGVFGAIAFTVGKYGIGSLQQLGYLVALFYASVIIFVFGILGLIMRMAGFSLIKFLAYLREELTIVLGTASSDSVLPQVMRKLEKMGIKDSTVGLVIPTGYSFNLDAFSIYLTLAAVFIAQAMNTPLSTSDLLVVLGIALLTSKGAHGVPGSAIVVLAATLSAVPVIPAIGLVLVLSVDWFMGMARALGNLIGNCVATVVIAAWGGDIDRVRAHKVLNGEMDGSTEELLDVGTDTVRADEPRASLAH
ncbi:cation:dicarboxylate symporter family transporter [Mesorhizobium sp. LjNodule214]|uniref:cation:dicarboxylate symporter family transporter n=1 Tax=Mesorhizobium sp. LjNodule214 TaxID=3342252 RepID=UPI003F4F6BFF